MKEPANSFCFTWGTNLIKLLSQKFHKGYNGYIKDGRSNS